MNKTLEISSLWGEDFSCGPSLEESKKIIQKIKQPKEMKVEKIIKSTKVSLDEKLRLVEENVHRILGSYANNTVVLHTREELHAYIGKALLNHIIAIDTETNHSLDPLTCLLMGGCIYTPGEKNAYIPVNHVNPVTNEKLPNQVTEQDIAEEFSRLKDIDIITHNGKFDYQVLKCTTGWEMPITWDTMLGAKLLDTTERAGLKQQYVSKIDSSIEKYNIETFFSDIPYEVVDPEVFALYAATDAYMTYKLYLYQKKLFDKPENAGLLNVMTTIEIPVLIPVAEMELNGVSIDRDYALRLSQKYHKKLDTVDAAIARELGAMAPQIAQWRLTPDANAKKGSKTITSGNTKYIYIEASGGPGDVPYWCEEKSNRQLSTDEALALGLSFNKKSKSEQLADPPNLASPTQLAILIYDVFKTKPVSKKTPRGTGEDILSKINLPICKLITERRGLMKLINTYIDKIPECTNPKDGKVHANFHQYGAETGRFSSSEPNLQNIPSHEKSIRLIFQASPGCVMLGGDFSAQEPKLLATYSQDPTMIKAFRDEKDLYAIIAEKVYNNKYEDNLQTHADGSPFPEGKARRSNCKSVLLGLMYGRGVASVAEQIHKPVEEAQEIFDKFYQDFPRVKSWMEDTQEFAREQGYVEDLWGRRRHLPDIQLPKFTVTLKDNKGNSTFNPLIGSKGIITRIKNPLVEKYENLCKKVHSKIDKDQLKSQADAEGVSLQDNQGFIAEAERQSINARIQGGAASMSKKAMTTIYYDEEMRRLGFKLLIMVHDELIGECPIENQEAAMERLSYLMSEAGKPEVDLPMKCDVVAFSHWYLDEYTDMMCDKFDEMHKKGMTPSEIFNSLLCDHSECTEEMLKDILKSRLE